MTEHEVLQELNKAINVIKDCLEDEGKSKSDVELIAEFEDVIICLAQAEYGRLCRRVIDKLK